MEFFNMLGTRCVLEFMKSKWHFLLNGLACVCSLQLVCQLIKYT